MADIRLQGLIENACKPTTPSFDLTLGKQICELVNEKQGSFPRLAALKIAKLVISKNAQQAMHALSLLNLCVLECGFPFHLQMSTNEFINEITKRTPLIPYHNIAPAETRKPKESTEHTWNHFDYIPTQPSTSDRVNERLLYMIKEWAIAFQHDTLYREDMERLVKLYHCLKQFNYPFPDVSDSPLVESFTSPKLLTPDEMLEKAKMYLTTKFHEYVRRSKSPDDENTRIANALLKCIITDEKHQQAFTKFKEELFPQMVRGIKCKAIVLYEQLEAMKPDDKIDKPMKDLQKVLCNARTKIKRMLADKNLDLRDLVVPLDALIDKVLAKYSDVEQGIYNTSYDIFNKNQVQETSTTTFGSLIDLEDQSLPVNTMPSPPVETKPSFDVDIPLSRIVTLLDKNGLQIHLEIYENSNDNSMKLKALYSNQSIAPMEDMNLSITATNASSITMEPASSSVIRPKSVKTVHQNIILSNVKERQLCCSYRVTYYQLGVLMEQSGEYQENL